MDFAAGMAEEGADILEEKRKYIREKRQSNRDWLDTYGKKIVAERQESVNSVLNMSNYIIGRGVERTFVDYLYDQGGVPAISNMYNSIKDDTSITGREAQAFVGDIGTYTSPDTPLADRIKEGFGMYTRAETPDRQEENNFFSGLGLLFGDETEYADRDLDQLAVDGFTGRDVKAMAGLPSTPEAPGLVEFDYSALPASQASVAEKRALAAEIESNLETLVEDKIDDLRIASDTASQQKLQDLLDSKDYAGIGRLYPDLLQPAVNAAKRFENEYPGSMTDNALLEQSFADYYIAQTVPLTLEDKHKNMTDQGIEVPPLDTLREFDSDEAAAEELVPDS